MGPGFYMAEKRYSVQECDATMLMQGTHAGKLKIPARNIRQKANQYCNGPGPSLRAGGAYSTVTLFARFLGLSTSTPLAMPT